MNPVQQTLVAVPLHNGNAAQQITVDLTWYPERPDEIFATFHATHEDVDWTFDRDLIAAGLDGPAGFGDVSIFPDLTCPFASRIELVLDTPTGRAAIVMAIADLARFLAATQGTTTTAGGAW